MRLIAKFIFVLTVSSVCVFANAQGISPGEKPAASPASLVPMFGEYMMGDKKIIIREDGGRLQAVFNPTYDGSTPEELKFWPLSFISPGKYTYSFKGEFANIIFQFNDDGVAKSFMLGNDLYVRNFIEPRDGNTFKVTLDKPIEEYIADALKGTPPAASDDALEADLVDVSKYIDNVKLDVRYATNNNFLSAPTYSEAKSFIQRPAAEALVKANESLNELGYGLLIHDAYRPWYVSKVFWDATEGDERNFVANPDSGSIHNRGSAIDLTLYDLATGEAIKMVGTYDEMSDRSYPYYMGGTSLERWHRELLKNAMENVGFTVLSNEWWHFDYKDWQKYPILNKTFDELSK
ncbi:M15 family metallopeptidase [Pseudemcibacter aquimaris]|uniref:M15 family metallopeptidase n=1 Tax=Pseudemcibacter aquimaris TaxID=2857064 RepID=UPI00201156EA|nr:M15 family metallopeptidase [Pseudemcibacter aquimaris]MCC3859809.1 M15 family metallopeptidase [Pseudemcibacter aquimaris]WDU60203.1 M15 family metallopeptidase [Pseudemcibacter aquimaris]